MMKPFRVRNFRFVNIDGIVCIDKRVVASHGVLDATYGGWRVAVDRTACWI